LTNLEPSLWEVEPWLDVPFPSPSGEQLHAVLAKHGLGSRSIEPLASTGVLNAIFALGDDLVLRIPKPIDEGFADTYTESVAVPVAHAAGVTTPDLVVFDDDRDIFDVPYTIYERVHAETLAHASWTPDACRELGRDLAVLHAGVSECPDPLGRLDDPGRWESAEFAATLARSGFLSPANVAFIEDLFTRVEPALIAARGCRRFVHNDVQDTNVMVKDGHYAALIDWGDAGWGDPAIDFRTMSMRGVPHALAGYREVQPLEEDDTAEARVIWDRLWSAASSLTKRPHPDRSDVGGAPGGRLLDLVSFLLSEDGRDWLRF
jgi:aminoglycoside phosphotransferase (APT) family kinase protein